MKTTPRGRALPAHTQPPTPTAPPPAPLTRILIRTLTLTTPAPLTPPLPLGLSLTHPHPCQAWMQQFASFLVYANPLLVDAGEESEPGPVERLQVGVVWYGWTSLYHPYRPYLTPSPYRAAAGGCRVVCVVLPVSPIQARTPV